MVFECAEVSTLLPLDALRCAGKLQLLSEMRSTHSLYVNIQLWPHSRQFVLAASSGAFFLETTRAGSTCPPHNVHRDVIALQRPARAEGR